MSELIWKRGIPTEEECETCVLIFGANGDRPIFHADSAFSPSETEQGHWSSVSWYCVVSVPEPKWRELQDGEVIPASAQHKRTDSWNPDWVATRDAGKIHDRSVRRRVPAYHPITVQTNDCCELCGCELTQKLSMSFCSNCQTKDKT